MKVVLGFVFIFLVGCAGSDADVEKAKYLLGKGDTASAAQAVALMAPYLNDSNPGLKLEATRLWAGAKMIQAGFDSIEILSKAAYKSGDDTVTSLAEALVGLSSDAATLLSDAETQLTTIMSDSAYTNADSRTKKGLQFQRALARLFNALRISVVESGIISSGDTVSITSAACQGDLAISDANQVATDLEDADDDLEGSGFDSTNDLVELINDMQAQIDADEDGDVDGADDASALEAYCDYLEAQSGGF